MGSGMPGSIFVKHTGAYNRGKRRPVQFSKGSFGKARFIFSVDSNRGLARVGLRKASPAQERVAQILAGHVSIYQIFSRQDITGPCHSTGDTPFLLQQGLARMSKAHVSTDLGAAV